jgi:anthranilate phosphoribosyltransferase
MFAALLEKLQRREDLTTEEASAAMNVIMDGGRSRRRSRPAHRPGDERASGPPKWSVFAQTMRARATRLSQDYRPVFDTCGTGGDPRPHLQRLDESRRWCSPRAGVRVAKHGNRSVSSQCGSADLFEALGVNVAAEPAVVERVSRKLESPSSSRRRFIRRCAMPDRRGGSSASRTAFNLLGPLTNPAGAARQLVAVPRPELTELVARSLALLGSERAWVVHGADGLDEISTGGYTKVSECRDGEVNTFYLHPTDIGLSKSAPDALRGGNAADNAAIAQRVLAGEPGPQRDVVLLNTAAALLIAGKVDRIRDGLAMAAEALDNGRAASVLDCLRRLSTESPVATGTPDQTGTDHPMSSTTADLLGTIVAATERIVEVRAREVSVGELERRCATAGRQPQGEAFERALRTSAAPRVIAECKRRSPSRGILRHDYDPAAHARSYAAPARRRSRC